VGWWALASLLVAAALGVWLWRRWQRRPLGLKRAALIELDAIRADYQRTKDPLAALQRLSVLMRRLALSLRPRTDVAGKHGTEWLRILDGLSGNAAFSTGVGAVLAHGPYAPRVDSDLAPLFDLCARTIGAVSRRPARLRHTPAARQNAGVHHAT
jgi:hypothetical protein